ncbi:extracellular solute-binding protein [Anaerobium acetethylicum]|uniref:Arabinogalactan oligomer / maltooligosaccharide transport system substrate-binding protein n=1 Tax=Anaerobium acetethylicum TaxID=1619234 RepID=A0A1D3TYG8_9FIRM|nr:extracellular solute-binding protein [Anaerobium acetethylicum]SCP99479.1 arabinogalactan oligomer / maltooligosaccharide transport system substrate-binding protein [Anaerobium acetethylicum]
MKKFKKIVTLMTVATMVGASLMGCGKDDTDNNTNTAEETKEVTEVTEVALKVWGPQEEQAANGSYSEGILKAMCDKFAEEHPEWDITFEYGVVSEADAKTELNKDAAAGADVFMFASDQTAELVENGILAPLTLYADDIIASNGEAAIEAATFDDLLYAVPFTPNSWFLYYDKSKFTEDEVKSLDAMMAKDLGADVDNFSIDLDNGWYNAAFFFAGGCTLFGEDGLDATDCTFNSPAGLAVGNYLVDLATSDRFLMFSDGNALTAFADGKLGAYCSGTWEAAAIQEALGENYGAAKLPAITLDGKEAQLSSFADFKYIGVNMNSEYPEAAQALAAYLGGEECQKIRFEARSIAPTNINLVEDPAVAANAAVVALNEQSGHATLQSTIAQMGNFWTPAEAFGAGVYSGEITKENMQEALDAFVESILTTLK